MQRKTKQTYLYFVEFEDGRISLHQHLHKSKAVSMYRAQERGDRQGVKEFGWELENPSLLSQQVLLNRAAKSTSV